MLSRVADNLYWMSRYLERAVHTARLLDVNLHSRLDHRPDQGGERWSRLLRSLAVPAHEGDPEEPFQVVDRLGFDRAEPYSIVSCLVTARRNAREVREQISTEMWEQLNRLYLHVERTQRTASSNGRAYEFFQLIKEGSYLFHGVASTTMSREEGWYFMQLGRHVERVIATVNLLDAHLDGREPPTAGPDLYLEWMGLLKSCTALEAYSRVHTANIQPERAVAFLLLNPNFPHSVRFGADTIQTSLEALSELNPVLKQSGVHRRVGKLVSALSFDSIEEIFAHDMHAFLVGIRQGCQEVHTAIYDACISYPVEHALTA